MSGKRVGKEARRKTLEVGREGVRKKTKLTIKSYDV
jgi:hypothetical protein